MKFPTAKEIRESAKQNNKKTIKLARKKFNKYKKSFSAQLLLLQVKDFLNITASFSILQSFLIGIIKKSIKKNISALPLAFLLLVGIKFPFIRLPQLSQLLGRGWLSIGETKSK